MHSFRHLEIIRALAVHRNFGRAANSLGISQPVLSRTLAYIEKELGFKLFERGSGVTEPTNLGQIFVDRCGVTLDEIAGALREIRLLQGLEAGALNVVAGPFPSEISVQAAIASLASRSPKLNISLSTKLFKDAIRDVLDSRADLAIADIADLIENSHPEIKTEPLPQRAVKFCCRAGHPLCKHASISLQDVFSFPAAGVAWPKRVSHLLPSDVSKAGTIDHETGYFIPVILVDSLSAALRIVRGSDAITVVTPSYIQSNFRADELTLLPLELPWTNLNYGFITRKGRTMSPAAYEFIKSVSRIEASIP